MNKLFCFPAGRTDGLEITLLFDGKFSNRLARCANTFGDAVCPIRFDPDDNNSGNIWVCACANHRTEMQIQIFTKLQTTIGMRQGQRTLYIVRHGLDRRIGNIVHWQNNDMITNADTTILAAVSFESHI